MRSPDFFNLPSSRAVALGGTQPLPEISTSNLSGVKARPASKADLTAICEHFFLCKGLEVSQPYRPTRPIYMSELSGISNEYCTDLFHICRHSPPKRPCY
jgi:hypothetical protein